MKFTNQIQTLTSKQKIGSTTYHITYTIPIEFEYIPGQYVGIQINPTHRRAYSILQSSYGQIEFLIDTSPGGQASRFFEAAEVGKKNLIIGPYGRFFPKVSDKPKVLISTGTGIVPFLSWILNNKTFNESNCIKIIFGATTLENELAFRFLSGYPKVKIIHCISRQEIPSDYNLKFPNCTFFSGRVTTFLQEKFKDEHCEFYVCGADHMIKDVSEVLLKKFNTVPFIEGYG